MSYLPGLNHAASSSYTLVHEDVDLGYVSNLSSNQPWVLADYCPNDAAQRFRGFFDACTDENREFPDTNGEFPNQFLDDTLWFMQTEAGEPLPICLPAVHWAVGAISWRWRQG